MKKTIMTKEGKINESLLKNHTNYLKELEQIQNN
jgi:hypothetical protein